MLTETVEHDLSIRHQYHMAIDTQIHHSSEFGLPSNTNCVRAIDIVKIHSYRVLLTTATKIHRRMMAFRMCTIDIDF